jgi:2-aminoethylphosphonate-pyruvate transaminase
MRDPVLLTPGPLTTTLATKTAMLHDYGSWDADFNRLTATVCDQLLAIIQPAEQEFVCVPLQGSGTFAVEAAIGSLMPRDGKLLVLVNGAYGKRMAQLTQMMGRACAVIDAGETSAIDPEQVRSYLTDHPEITHVGVIYVETSTGILNPLSQIAEIVQAAGKRLIIDAMSAFGALPLDSRNLHFDAVIASSNKCLEGVPGMGFVLARRTALMAAEGNSQSLSLDLYQQWIYMQRTGQWRYTPPTHVVAALAKALEQYQASGAQAGRLARYQQLCDHLLQGLAALGLRSFLPAEIQAPIIVTVYAPAHANWQFQRFYELVKQRGYILYPGKLTEVETFRIGCIGAIQTADLDGALAAIADALQQMGISTT